MMAILMFSKTKKKSYANYRKQMIVNDDNQIDNK